MRTNKRCQSVLEYCIFLGVVAAAFGAMQVYAKRGIQAAVKSTADVFGGQDETYMSFSGTDEEKAKKQKLFYRNRVSETKGTSSIRSAQKKDISNGVVNETSVSQSETYFSGSSVSEISLPENLTTTLPEDTTGTETTASAAADTSKTLGQTVGDSLSAAADSVADFFSSFHW